MLLRTLLPIAVVVPWLAAQQPSNEEWDQILRQRFERGEDLIELRYRRDAHGLLEVSSCEHGAIPFHPMFPATLLPFDAQPSTLLALLLFGCQGQRGVLACTDSERHLRRAGIEVAPVALRQVLVAPFASDDPVRARVELQDRMVAIDWLVRGGHRGAVAELTALAERPDTAPPLAAHAAAALAAFGKRAERPRQRLTVESLQLPMVADVWLAVDHAALPDPAPLLALARKLAIESSYRLVAKLRAPTPDDLYLGQFIADLLGELPFEVARRFGDLRCDHTVAGLLLQLPGTALPIAWHLQSAGDFETAPLAATMAELAAVPGSGVQCEQRDGAVHVTAAAAEFDVAPDMLVTHSQGMRGRARPELARELLADGAALRVVVPPASKAWLALGMLKLPPAGRIELCMSFGARWRVQIQVAARDEEAAADWVDCGEQLRADALERVQQAIAAGIVPAAAMQTVVTALTATAITTDGARAQAVLECAPPEEATLEAMGKLVRPFLHQASSGFR